MVKGLATPLISVVILLGIVYILYGKMPIWLMAIVQSIFMLFFAIGIVLIIGSLIIGAIMLLTYSHG